MVTARVRRCLVPALLGLTACELGTTTIPLAEPELVVHAVLNPSLGSQVILVEESLTGKNTGPKQNFDPSNPIVSSNGVPVRNALVEITREDGATFTATEIVNAPGLYGVTLNVNPGTRYDLRIVALGKTVTGTTFVPRAPAPGAIAAVAFNRDRDSVRVPIPQIDLARGYWVRIETPLSSFSILTTDRDVRISGDARNLFTDDLFRVFIPGFRQTMTVAAVDTNLLDFYRSGNDPFSGTGLINHLHGGLGVFGSIAVMERRILDVGKDSTHAIEGSYTARPAVPGWPQSLRLYVESPAASPGADDRMSGFYVEGGARGGMLGRRFKADSLELTLYANQNPGRMIDLRAVIRSDTIHAFLVFSSGNSTSLKFVRAGK